MNIGESIFSCFVVVVFGLILGVAIPSCMQGQRAAMIKCLETRPSLSQVDCTRAIPQ